MAELRIRQAPEKLRIRLKQKAAELNVSMNQLMLDLLTAGVASQGGKRL